MCPTADSYATGRPNVVGTLPPEYLEKGLWPRTIEELRAFIGIADKKDVDVSAKLNDLFKQIAELTDGLVMSTIEKRTASEFTAQAMVQFNDYVRVLRARSDLLKVVFRGNIRATERIVNQGLCELEADFRENGIKLFGSSVSDQAVFTIWTLRKTAAQIWKLLDTPNAAVSDPDSVQKLQKLGSEFALYSAWAQFHLECLTTSMRLKVAPYPDVLPAIIDGLRSEVNAYSIAKQITNLCLPPTEEPPIVPYEWDQEDDELLASSMRDLELEQH